LAYAARPSVRLSKKGFSSSTIRTFFTTIVRQIVCHKVAYRICLKNQQVIY
jgi:hypothetical protein